MTSIAATTNLVNRPVRAARAGEASATPSPNDRLSLGGRTDDLVLMQPSRGAAGAPTAERPAERKPAAAELPLWMRAVSFGLAGAIGIGALTGCTPKSQGPTEQLTEAQKQAREQLQNRLSEIEKSMKDMPAGGNGQLQAEQITRQVIDAARTYARDTGRSGPGVIEDLRQFMVDHPAITITSLFALGTATGVGLEKVGFTDGVSKGVHNVYEWAKANPLLATGVALAAAGGTAYLVYQINQAEGDIPEKPSTPEARTLEQTFSDLEQKITENPKIDAKEVNASLLDAVNRYKEESGKTWENVVNDVKAFAYEHPVVAATVVVSAGVGTGVVLERAGVPDKVAGLIGSALGSSRDGVGRLAQLVKDHPVVSGAVAVGVAAGAGYLIYQHVNAAPATPAQ